MTHEDAVAPSHVWSDLARGALPAAVYAAYLAAAAASLTGLVAERDVFLLLSGTAALGVLAIGAGLRRYYVWAHMSCADLDEREQRLRARAYEFSYGVLIGAVFLAIVVPTFLIAPGPLQGGVLRASAFGFILLSATLPTATLAWRDRVGAAGPVGVRGTISRRTLLLWACSAAAGVVAGFALGFWSQA
jgi:hypothetical protein